MVNQFPLPVASQVTPPAHRPAARYLFASLVHCFPTPTRRPAEAAHCTHLLCFHTVPHSFACVENLSPVPSATSALFLQNTRGGIPPVPSSVPCFFTSSPPCFPSHTNLPTQPHSAQFPTRGSTLLYSSISGSLSRVAPPIAAAETVSLSQPSKPSNDTCVQGS
jgi:hypothetical protein